MSSAALLPTLVLTSMVCLACAPVEDILEDDSLASADGDEGDEGPDAGPEPAAGVRLTVGFECPPRADRIAIEGYPPGDRAGGATFTGEFACADGHGTLTHPAGAYDVIAVPRAAHHEFFGAGPYLSEGDDGDETSITATFTHTPLLRASWRIDGWVPVNSVCGDEVPDDLYVAAEVRPTTEDEPILGEYPCDTAEAYFDLAAGEYDVTFSLHRRGDGELDRVPTARVAIGDDEIVDLGVFDFAAE
jgi:hypothetical protein